MKLEGVSLETLVFKVVLLFVGLQEIKSMEVKDSLDRQIWGSSTFQCEVIDPMGLSVGIASLWDPSLFNATDSIKGEAFLAIRGMWLRLRRKFFFVNVYAPQEPSKKGLFGIIFSTL